MVLSRFTSTTSLSLVAVVVLVGGLAVAVVGSQQQQDNRSKAAEKAVGDQISQGSISGKNATGPKISGLVVGTTYKVVVSGVVDYDGDGTHIKVDPQWGGTTSSPSCWCQRYAQPKFNGTGLRAQNTGASYDPGANHSYTYLWKATTDSLQFSVTDSNLSDNTGSWSYVMTIHELPGGTATLTITKTPTHTPVPPQSQNTKLKLDLLLHGVGSAGDNVNPTGGGGNFDLVHLQRVVRVEVVNTEDEIIASNLNGLVIFDSQSGSFKGTVDMGDDITVSGNYGLKVKLTQSLKKFKLQTINVGTTNTIPQMTLVNGDVNDDNFVSINVADYNILLGCYSDFLPAEDCDAARKVKADLNDDGDVNFADLNLFLRELNTASGQ